MEFARTTQDDLHRHFFPHTVLGPMNGYEWLIANARHAELHAGISGNCGRWMGFQLGSFSDAQLWELAD